jgi:hypothetical protein
MRGRLIAAALADLRFGSIKPGMTFGPVELTVSEHLLKAHAFALDDYALLQHDEGLADAIVLVPELLRLLNTRFDPDTMVGLHQKEEIFLRSPVRVGETAVLEGRCVDRYARRGRGCFVMEADARSAEDGRVLVSHRTVEIAELDPSLPESSPSRPEPERRVACAVDPTRAPVARAEASLASGTSLPPLRKTVHQDQIAVFSNAGRFWRNIHTDLEQARRLGYERTLVQGLMQTMHIAQLGARFFGGAWRTSGWIWTVFLKPLLEGEPATVLAAVGGSRDGRLELEAWVETDDATRTAVGLLGADVSA